MDNKTYSLSDFLSIFLRWKKFLIINLIVIIIATTGATFLIPEKYKSTSTVMIASNSGGLGQLTGMLKDVKSLFGKSTGSADPSEQIFALLGSRTFQWDLVEQFDLVGYYEFTNYKRDLTLKEFANDFIYDLDDNEMLAISMTHKNKQTAADIVNYVVKKIDSVNISFNLKQAQNYKNFIGERYNRSLDDFAAASENFKEFQIRTGVIAIPEQLQVVVEAMVKFESEIAKKEVELAVLKSQKSESDPIVQNAEKALELLKEKINSIKDGTYKSGNSVAFIPLKKLPEIQREYIDVFMAMELQTKILEVLTPLYEQALMDAQKEIPTMILIDEALPSELKESPKKAVIILAVFFLSFFIMVFLVVRADGATKEGDAKNEFEGLEKRIFSSIKSLYRI